MKLLLIALLLLTADTVTEPQTDTAAWVDPDGMLVIHVEQDGELLYFDSFNIEALHDIVQSRSLRWQDRWEFRRE